MIFPSAREISGRGPRRRNSRTASRAHRNCPVRLTSMTVFQSAQRHVLERRVALQPGIGDDDVERAEGRAGFLEHLGDLRLARHVGAQRHRAAAHRSDQVGDFMGFVLAGDVVDDNGRAGLGQGDRHRPADPRIGAGDQSLLPGQLGWRRAMRERRISVCSLRSIATSDLPCTRGSAARCRAEMPLARSIRCAPPIALGASGIRAYLLSRLPGKGTAGAWRCIRSATFWRSRTR